MSKEEASSPTVATESIVLIGNIDAKEMRDVMTLDIPNAFVQTPAGTTEDGERIIMKIRGALVDMLVDLDPLIYKDYVSIVNGKKILYVQVLKEINGMLQSALLFYKRLRNDLESSGFKINPYDPCVANRNGTLHTVVWHVYDLKSSHKSAQVNDSFHNWLNEKYGNESIGIVTAVRGKMHKYLAMTLDYSENEILQIYMQEYVEEMIKEFPYDLGDKKVKYPWDQNLFKIGNEEKNTQLKGKDHEFFHAFVAKGLFLAKRVRPDIMPCMAFLTTRVINPTEEDWDKLILFLQFLKNTKDDKLRLSMDDTWIAKWYLDASFAVHNDMRSQTGAIMTLGKGAAQVVSTKQKTNTRSSTGAELISFDDIASKVLWTIIFK